jgi:hypothetical protein
MKYTIFKLLDINLTTQFKNRLQFKIGIKFEIQFLRDKSSSKFRLVLKVEKQ